MKNYTNYLFDADGTLIDTAELIYQAFKYSCRKFAGKEIAADVVKQSIGLPIRTLMEMHIGPMPDDRYARIFPEHMAYQRSIRGDYLKLFPGVAEGLDALKAQGKRLAVVSSRNQETLTLYLQEMGVYDLFDAVVPPEFTEKHKPHPDPALKALAMLAGDAKESLFIGDAEFDMECGRRAGMDTAFVAWSHNDPESLKTPPTLVLEDMRDLAGSKSFAG
jgi:pyrophosphatase PpaX